MKSPYRKGIAFLVSLMLLMGTPSVAAAECMCGYTEGTLELATPNGLICTGNNVDARASCLYFVVDGRFNGGNSLSGYQWSVTSKALEKCAYCDRIFIKKTGWAEVTAINAKNNTMSSAEINVVNPFYRTTQIKMTQTEQELEVSGGVQLSASVLPSNASNRNSMEWSSSNNAVATVSKSGYVRAKSAGTATISARICEIDNQGGNEKVAVCKVTVTAPAEERASKVIDITNGKEYTVALAAENLLSTSASEYILTYDPLKLKPLDMKAHTYLKDESVTNNSDGGVKVKSVNSGRIVFDVTGNKEAVVALSGILNTIRFKALSTGSAKLVMSSR